MSQWTKDQYWHKPEKFELAGFGNADDPLLKLKDSLQLRYLRRYLEGLNCSSVLLEPSYFDRDYLSEFSEFYSLSARGYPNTCQRLHFFSCPPVSEDEFTRALGGDEDMADRLKKSYLGFSVVRPIPSAQFGRTVISWFPDLEDSKTPRIKALREYVANVAGLTLKVKGLAWQQQDTGVGACATVALWSALHSYAFDEHHAVPTTAQITKAANRKAALGKRDFPSSGLTNSQMLEAVKELGLAPAIEQGDCPNRAFSPQRFGALCNAFLRSGYPVLISGPVAGRNSRHAVCLVGFREPAMAAPKPNTIQLIGEDMRILYVHDDNIGANVRFEIIEKNEGCFASKYSYVTIAPKGPEREKYWPQSNDPDPTEKYWSLIPDSILVAVNGDIRTSPSTLSDTGVAIGKLLCATTGVRFGALQG